MLDRPQENPDPEKTPPASRAGRMSAKRQFQALIEGKDKSATNTKENPTGQVDTAGGKDEKAAEKVLTLDQNGKVSIHAILKNLEALISRKVLKIQKTWRITLNSDNNRNIQNIAEDLLQKDAIFQSNDGNELRELMKMKSEIEKSISKDGNIYIQETKHYQQDDIHLSYKRIFQGYKDKIAEISKSSGTGSVEHGRKRVSDRDYFGFNDQDHWRSEEAILEFVNSWIKELGEQKYKGDKETLEGMEEDKNDKLVPGEVVCEVLEQGFKINGLEGMKQAERILRALTVSGKDWEIDEEALWEKTREIQARHPNS